MYDKNVLGYRYIYYALICYPNGLVLYIDYFWRNNVHMHAHFTASFKINGSILFCYIEFYFSAYKFTVEKKKLWRLWNGTVPFNVS